MASRFAPKRAVRRGQKSRVLLAGPSGSGKTWTALEAAAILGDTILAIDTERGSASLYADFYTFDTIEFEPPFDPRELADCIDEFATKYDVIVVDSLSHFWEGEGGTRDIVDAAAARSRGNSFAGWKEGTPAQNDMIASLLAAQCHIVATVRSKTEYVLETDSRGKQVPKKVGMAPIQRAGIEYEFTVTADLDYEHTLLIDKTRCHALAGKMFKMGHTVEMAEALAAWLDTAEAAEPPAPRTVDPVVARDNSAAAARDATSATWAKALTGDQAARWAAWKSEHEGWSGTDSGRNDAYIELGHLFAAEQAAAGEEPFERDNPGEEVPGDVTPSSAPDVDSSPSNEVVKPEEPQVASIARDEGASEPIAAPAEPPTSTDAPERVARAGTARQAEGGTSPMATRPRLARLQQLCQHAQVGDRDARLAWASDELCRKVQSFNDLTVDEAEELIEAAGERVAAVEAAAAAEATPEPPLFDGAPT